MRIIAVAHIDIDAGGVPTLLDGSWGVVSVTRNLAPTPDPFVQLLIQEINGGPATPGDLSVDGTIALTAGGKSGTIVGAPTAVPNLILLQGESASEGGAGGLILAKASYTPSIVASGGGVINPLGQFAAHLIGDEVMVVGGFNFTPAVAGTGEAIVISTPPAIPPAGGGVFPFAGSASGGAMGGLVAADVVSALEAVPASPNVQITTVIAAAAMDVGVTFKYAGGPFVPTAGALSSVAPAQLIPASSRITAVVRRRTPAPTPWKA